MACQIYFDFFLKSNYMVIIAMHEIVLQRGIRVGWGGVGQAPFSKVVSLANSVEVTFRRPE